MKKRIIATLLCLSMVLSMAACKSKETSGDGIQRSNVIETDSETGEQYYLMGDFENYFECTQVKYEASFGTVTEVKKSKNPEMVTYGKQSAKLEILGTENTWQKRIPTLRFATNTDFFNLTTNFSNMTKFTFDIYNDMDYEVTIRFCVDDVLNPEGFDFTHDYQMVMDENREDVVTTKIYLEPKAWNHVEISVDEIRVLKDSVMTYGAEGLNQVGAFLLLFDRGELHEKEQVYYIDNVRVYFDGEVKTESATEVDTEK